MSDAGELRDFFDEIEPLPPAEREARLRRHPNQSVADKVRKLLESADQASVLDRSPVWDWKAEPVFPERIGPYRVEGELGRGGMGVVYRAARSDDAYQKTVAVKVVGGGMPPEVFKRERQIMASLDHPHIARLHDGGATDSGALYFVMEYVEGEPLDKYIQRTAPGVKTRVALFLQICGAVEYAHRHLVVHRDLKPGNILIDQEGNAKLLDFGIAKVLDPGQETGAATLQAGMTPRYASPEQLTGQPVHVSTDIYSLGVILFEMLSGGVHPFNAADQSLAGYVEAVLREEPRRLSQLVKVDRDLESITAKAMARDAERRYETVAQLRRDIENYVSGLPVTARPASAAYRVRKFAARNRALVALAALLALAVAGGVAATVREYRIANRERAAALQAASEARDLAAQREQMRLQAENHAAEAARDRARAETSAREALEQRDRARQRLATAQSLASSIIFDAYDGVRDLPGRADAKVRIVDKTLLHLERLMSESPGDVKTMDLLANAYLRAGDLSSGLTGEGVDNNGAVKYFRRLVELREQVARAGGGAGPTAVPMARIRLANALGRVLQVGEGVAETRRAIQEYDRLPAPVRASSEGHQARLAIYGFACELTGFNNMMREALQYCGQARELAAALDAEADPKVLLMRGANWGKLAVQLRNNGQPQEAAALLNAAIDSYSAYLKKDPNSADAQRGVAVLLARQAILLDDAGNAEAFAGYDKAVASLSRMVQIAGPRSQPEQILAWIQMRYASRLSRSGEPDRAREQAQRSLAIYAARTNGPSPTPVDLNDHADNLMKCPIPELRNPAEALVLSQRAVAQMTTPNVSLLDTLANALYLNGRKTEAIATVRQALAQLDKQPSPALRAEVEASLKKFLAGE